MSFGSILFNTETEVQDVMPEFFTDLNLDQVIDELCTGMEEYNLKPFYYSHLMHGDDIVYRQDVFKDMEDPHVMQIIKSFTVTMRQMRSALTIYEKCDYPHQKHRLFLDIVAQYCDSVKLLENELAHTAIQSAGLLSFVSFLKNYIETEQFTGLMKEINELKAALASVQYKIVIHDLRVQVLKYNSEPDYSKEIEKTFLKFRQQPLKDYRMRFDEREEMNHVEASILDGVASLYPVLFERLSQFNSMHTNYLLNTIALFDREVQFYVAWLKYTSPIKQYGLSFCYPKITEASKHISNDSSFDIALASKLVKEKKQIVTNDFYLQNQERIIIVTGPNQGGKTTFARTFGQLHFLGCIGCCVPGTAAKIFLYDQLLTHFEKEEKVETHRSKFEDDLLRIHQMLSKATSHSILILNEIFSSTTLQDAIFLNKKIMEITDRLDMLCVWVTFIDELIALSNKTVSMLSAIDPGNPAIRTFKIIRKPANGIAYALSIAERYGVTYSLLKERLKT